MIDLIPAPLQRLAVWAADRCVGGGWSPTLSLLGLAPTLRWAWSGELKDLRRVGAKA